LANLLSGIRRDLVDASAVVLCVLCVSKGTSAYMVCVFDHGDIPPASTNFDRVGKACIFIWGCCSYCSVNYLAQEFFAELIFFYAGNPPHRGGVFHCLANVRFWPKADTQTLPYSSSC